MAADQCKARLRARMVRAVLLISGIQLPFRRVTFSCWCDDYLIGIRNKQGLHLVRDLGWTH